MEFNGKQYPALYTPWNSTLIDLFKITDDEQTRLKTIISKDEKKARKRVRDKKYDAENRGWKQSQDEYQAGRKGAKQEKATQAKRLKEHGLSGRRIAHEMGVSEAMVRKYLAMEF